ncbi:MAG: prepilin peptidase [Rhodobacteraceae bacterium]|nr:prepilin peptidase [Paracoccaceae bacterium]
MAIPAAQAMWFLPFVLPLCLYVAFTDLREMRITNQAVIALALVFLLPGLAIVPMPEYLWRLSQMAIVLGLGVMFYAAGVMGAGDAKFAAVAAPFVAPGDATLLMMIFAANLLAAVATHRLAKNTPLRAVAPHWQSWNQTGKFPMGFSLGGTLAIYLLLGTLRGAGS